MRYLDVALSSLRFQMDGEIGSIGTDGQGLYFIRDGSAELTGKTGRMLTGPISISSCTACSGIFT